MQFLLQSLPRNMSLLQDHRFSLVGFFLAFLFLNSCSYADDISDADFIKKYDEIIAKIACDAMAQKDGAQMKVNLTRYSTYEELARVAFWNYGYNFKSNELKFGDDLSWKRSLVNTLFKIFKKSCPNEFSPHEYMNTFRELVMIYLNSVPEEWRGTNNTQSWQRMQVVLDACEKGLEKKYNFTGGLRMITGISVKRGDEEKTAELLPPQEKVDVLFNDVDMVVDNFWWVFSHAMGRCFDAIPNAAIYAPKLRALFIRDILKPLMNRWGDPGPLQNYGPIVGNFNINNVQRNIRYCVTGAYFANGIIELQMVRPLKVGYAQEGLNSVQNRKTGAAIA